MAKLILLRRGPGDLHRRLEQRAAEAGLSLSDFLLRALRRAAELPTPFELRERMRRRSRVHPKVSP
jgi:hypothetical protein